MAICGLQIAFFLVNERTSAVSDVQSLDALIEALRKLPGVGVKSAQRMAFHLLQRDQAGALQLARALDSAVNSVHHC